MVSGELTTLHRPAHANHKYPHDEAGAQVDPNPPGRSRQAEDDEDEEMLLPRRRADGRGGGCSGVALERLLCDAWPDCTMGRSKFSISPACPHDFPKIEFSKGRAW